jgi:membrane-bound lytic murein transglycosylase F
LCLIFALLIPLQAAASIFPNQWDRDFKSATDTFLPLGTDYRLLKALCWQESRFKYLAVSPAGAKGMCQFLDGTWSDAEKAIGVAPHEIWIPEVSIRAAAWYLGKLHRTWKAPRPAMDRMMISMASYNAGAGHLIKAQSICGGGNLYREIIPCLPQVTGRHSKETIDYVEQIIGKWWPRMLLQ